MTLAKAFDGYDISLRSGGLAGLDVLWQEHTGEVVYTCTMKEDILEPHCFSCSCILGHLVLLRIPRCINLPSNHLSERTYLLGLVLVQDFRVLTHTTWPYELL